MKIKLPEAWLFSRHTFEKPDFPVRRDWMAMLLCTAVLLAVLLLFAWSLLARLSNETASATPTQAEAFELLRSDLFKAFVKNYDEKRVRLQR